LSSQQSKLVLFILFTAGGASSACSALSSRPSRQITYAETAFQAASLAGAETTQPNLYQLAKDALLQARAAYRLKNFKLARQLAIKARHASEDAEFNALKVAANPGAIPAIQESDATTPIPKATPR
jgi:hypothetical protein